MNGMKNAIEGTHSRVYKMKDGISELQDRNFEITQSGLQRIKKHYKSLEGPCDSVKSTSIRKIAFWKEKRSREFI